MRPKQEFVDICRRNDIPVETQLEWMLDWVDEYHDSLAEHAKRKLAQDPTRKEKVSESPESALIWRIREILDEPDWSPDTPQDIMAAIRDFDDKVGNSAYVTCCLCAREVLAYTAHISEDGWIGDKCCWDERMR